MAAALATMDILEREGIANAAKVGERLLTRLRDWPSKYRVVGEVRGRGLMIGIEIVGDQKTRVPAPAIRDAIVDAAFHRGLLVLGCGETSVRLSPPLIVSAEQADVAVDIFEQCIAEASK
jgi:4-aminobutyrate aminotransferase